jgi:hypothetical protein
MSNYPNMSYCMNQNTLTALQQVVDTMQEDGVAFLRDLSHDERRAFHELFSTSQEFQRLAEELQSELEAGG